MITVRNLVLGIFVGCGALPAFANNTLFLPGDAFFYTRLDVQSAAELLAVDSPTFSYGSHWNGGFGCGFIGYEFLRVKDLPLDTRAAILEACKSLQTEVEKDLNLEGKISIFVYANDYDWKKHGLALQYNEDWVNQSLLFGTQRDHLRLESFVELPASIAQNWRDAELVKPLGAACPQLPNGHQQAWRETPVEIASANCSFVIIPDREFDNYVKPRNGLEVIEIAEGKLKRFVRENNDWKLK